tara:strand:- start:4287 stop:4814 length:528 start_codon:yes stop_codon:yes gene_type:complete
MKACHHPGLARTLAPAAEALLSVIEDGDMPDRIVEPLGTALLIIAETIEDDELGLTGVSPEVVFATTPGRFPEHPLVPTGSVPSQISPYVRKIYIAEIEAVRLAANADRKRQLSRSAYTLARIISAGALPSDHVLESLKLAASSLPEAEAEAVIAAAFRKGMRSPRKLPEVRPPR